MKRTLKLTMIFKENSDPFSWGSDAISYELYLTEDGHLDISEIGAFGDRTLVKRCKAETFEFGFMLLNEISKMNLDSFMNFIRKD